MPGPAGTGSLVDMSTPAPSPASSALTTTDPATGQDDAPIAAPGDGAAPATGPGTPTAGTRLVALDLVRLVAIVGMMSVHLLGPIAQDPERSGIVAGIARLADAIGDGNASTLFAVIGGGSLVLASRRRLERGERGRAVAAVLVRGACVTALGLVLELAPSTVIVVLVPFGLAMMITAPLLLVPSGVLLALGGVLVVLGRPLAAAVPGAVEFGAVTLLSLEDPAGLLRGIVLTGQYPLITWVPYLLLGVVLMRALLRGAQSDEAAGTSRRAVLLGAAAAMLGHTLPLLAGALGHSAPGSWYTAAPHTGTVADMLATAGLATALIGAATWCLPAERPLRGTAGAALRSAGAAPLSIYVGHVLLTGIALILAVLVTGGELTTMPWYVAGLGVLGLHVLLALGLGALLAARGSRGPLEALIARIVRRSVRG